MRMQLPPPESQYCDLHTAIAGRASCRRFSGDPLTVAQVSALLHAAYGTQGDASVSGLQFRARSAPSAGACYPLEIHLIARAVDGVALGTTYRYLASSHALEETAGHVSPEKVCWLFLDQQYVAAASAIAVIAGTLGAPMARYGERGYRYVLLEAGHVAQNLDLMSTALGLGSLNLGGFLDRELAEALRLTAEEVPLYGVALGRSASADGRDTREPSP